MTMELGIYTFAELATSGEGPAITPAQRMRNLIEEIELADQVGLDVFGVGEHHRPDFVVSSPAVARAPPPPLSSSPPRPPRWPRVRRAPRHPADQRGERALVRRPDPGLPGLRH